MTSNLTNRVYLDHNATTPVHPSVLGQCADWVAVWGNCSSIHWAGQDAKNLLREARAQVAQSLGVHPLEIIFTSGGSESNNTVLKSLSPSKTRKQIICSAVEHPSVLRTLEFLASSGFDITTIPVSREGRLDMQAFERALSENTALVTIMAANNETGHLFPIAEIAEMAHKVGALVHTDAVQAYGKIPLSLSKLNVDYASLSGHKVYALKGVGVLYCRRQSPFESLIHGGGQERGRRSGTENLLGIASLGFMAKNLNSQIPQQTPRLAALRDHMEERILNEIPDVTITGREEVRLANTASFIFAGVDGESLLMSLDLKGFAVSTGAACSSGNPEPSPTLLAMGLSRAEAQSSLRVSLGWSNTENEINAFVDELTLTIQRLRQIFHEMGSRKIPRSAQL